MNVWETVCTRRFWRRKTTRHHVLQETKQKAKGRESARMVSFYPFLSSWFPSVLSLIVSIWPLCHGWDCWVLIYNSCRSNMPPLWHPFANIHLVLLNNLGCLWSCVHCTTSTKKPACVDLFERFHPCWIYTYLWTLSQFWIYPTKPCETIHTIMDT